MSVVGHSGYPRQGHIDLKRRGMENGNIFHVFYYN